MASSTLYFNYQSDIYNVVVVSLGSFYSINNGQLGYQVPHFVGFERFLLSLIQLSHAHSLTHNLASFYTSFD